MAKKEEIEKEEREFQLEMLKIQIKNDVLLTQNTLALSIEFSILISLALTYLSFGLTSGNQFYIAYGAIIAIALFPLTTFTIRYFGSRKVEESLEKNLEQQLQPIREKFIDKKTS